MDNGQSTRWPEVRVAIDAMGGDNAPDEIVHGALCASRAGVGRLILVGDADRLRALLRAASPELEIDVVHAPGAIAMDATPSQTVRAADDTSLGIAINLVRDGRADAVVSAGNSGAFLSIALVRLRAIVGIARPAFAAIMPARHGPVVLIDAGANVDCRPEWLAQFGVMGSAYARAVLGIAEPRVGIVSIGEERGKGNAQIVEASQALARAPINFVGNVEGNDVFLHGADVFVTDGFVGNVMLKLSEGAGTFFSESVVDALRSGGVTSKVGALLARAALRGVGRRFSYETYGGAPLLGLRGICIGAHGRSNRTAIANAIRAAAAAAAGDVVGRITALMAPAAALSEPAGRESA